MLASGRVVGYRAERYIAREELRHLYRSVDVCRLAGVSYRQLDYWDRTGTLSPTGAAAGGSGTQRLYSCADLFVLRVLGALRAHGVALRIGREVAEAMRDRYGAIELGTVLVVDDDGARLVPPGDPPTGIALLVPLDAFHPPCCDPLAEAS